jgi:primary-amine oxidase
MYQVFMYMRDPANPTEADSNHYAFPLPFSPVIECNEFKVIRIDYMPTGVDNTIKPVTYKPTPPNEYIPEAQKLRTDLKPLHVVQPEGASFEVTLVGTTGNALKWQKWDFFVGESPRSSSERTRHGLMIFLTPRIQSARRHDSVRCALRRSANFLSRLPL